MSDADLVREATAAFDAAAQWNGPTIESELLVDNGHGDESEIASIIGADDDLIVAAKTLGLAKRLKIAKIANRPVAGKTLRYVQYWSLTFARCVSEESGHQRIALNERGTPVWWDDADAAAHQSKREELKAMRWHPLSC